MPLTADLAFQQAANAAAAKYDSRPAFITYVTNTHIEVPSMHRKLDVNRRVMVRSADDKAVIQDLPQGAQSVARAFPISPTFDALSYFRLVTYMGWHQRIETYLTEVTPIRFTNPTHSEGDVVVTSLRYYYPKFAPDTSDAPNGRTHLIMRPLPTLTTGNASDFYLSDVQIDNATMLPTQITYTGHEDRRFVVDYETIGDAWVIKHAFFEQTFFAPLKIGRVHYTADSSFDKYQFSPTAPDPRL